MVDITLILGIAVAVIVAIAVFKLITGVLKTLFVFVVLIALAGIIFGGLVLLDALKLKETLSSGEKIMLLSEEGSITEGSILGDESHPLSNEDLAYYAEVIENDGVELNGAVIFVVEKSLMSAEEPVNPIEIIKHYKAGNITIYPEGIALKVIRYIPSSLFTDVAQNFFEKESQEASG
jgi:hypothetical protein